MSFKSIIKSIFSYNPKKDYYFDILDDSQNYSNIPVLNEKKENIYPSLFKNLEYIKTSYNTLINSDIVIREFTLTIQKKMYNAFLFYIDGMIDSNLLNTSILNPLMLKKCSSNEKIITKTKNNIIIKKFPKFDLSNYLLYCLIPQNNISKKDNFKDLFNGVNSGNCALFVDTLNVAFDIEIKGFKQRSINSPNNEVVIKGAQEAFVENLRTNTSIIRRIINNENLIIENIDVGNITKTKCAICYMKNITNSNLVAEVKFRMNNLKIDSLTSSR